LASASGSASFFSKYFAGCHSQRAVPFSWFYWAGQWLPVTLVGLYFLRREGLSLASLGHVQDDAE
jgi:hypothetical protein